MDPNGKEERPDPAPEEGVEERRDERTGMRKMTLGEHLGELRSRLIISVIACFLGGTIFLMAKSFTMEMALGPYLKTWTWLVQDWMDDLEARHEKGELTESGKKHHLWVFGGTDPVTGTVTKGVREEILVFDANDPGTGISDGELKAHGFQYPRRLQLLGVIEFMVAWMKLAIIFGLLVSSPVVFHQMWRFIAAGLYEGERKKVMRCFPFTVLLFLGGVAFGYFFMIPYALYFMAQIAPQEYVSQGYAMREYISFFFSVTLALGLVFQLPVVMVGLARFGVMSADSIARKRKPFILGAFIVGAILTPPDPFTQVFMATPVLVLFEVGLLLARRSERKRDVAQQEAPASR